MRWSPKGRTRSALAPVPSAQGPELQAEHRPSPGRCRRGEQKRACLWIAASGRESLKTMPMIPSCDSASRNLPEIHA